MTGVSAMMNEQSRYRDLLQRDRVDGCALSVRLGQRGRQHRALQTLSQSVCRVGRRHRSAACANDENRTAKSPGQALDNAADIAGGVRARGAVAGQEAWATLPVRWCIDEGGDEAGLLQQRPHADQEVVTHSCRVTAPIKLQSPVASRKEYDNAARSLLVRVADQNADRYVALQCDRPFLFLRLHCFAGDQAGKCSAGSPSVVGRFSNSACEHLL